MSLKKLKGKKKGFTLIELMVVIVIIGILVAIALPNFIAAQDRAKASSVKANMHIIQTMLETYSVDWGGQYPTVVGANSTAGSVGLWPEATAKSYWKDFKNPFTGSTGLGNSFNDQTAALVVNTAVAGIEGVSLYNPTLTSTVTKYYVYGGGKGDIPLDDKGQLLTLTND